MITLYLWDAHGYLSGSREVDPKSELPAQSTTTPPPEVTPGEFVVWRAGEWRVTKTPPSPEPTPMPVDYPQFTALEVLDLFTEAEQLAIVAATMVEPAVKLWYDRLIAATFVTYEDPRTEGGLQALVDAGLLTPQRKAEIAAAMQPGGAST